jgi:hypothetical protein
MQAVIARRVEFILSEAEGPAEAILHFAGDFFGAAFLRNEPRLAMTAS